MKEENSHSSTNILNKLLSWKFMDILTGVYPQNLEWSGVLVRKKIWMALSAQFRTVTCNAKLAYVTITYERKGVLLCKT